MIETITDLCVITAIDVEFNIAADLLSGKSLAEERRMKICRGLVGERRVTVLRSEMGANGFAKWLAKHLASNRYDGLIVAGLAGALDPKLQVGDAVLYDLCYDARNVQQTEVCRSLPEEALSRLSRQTSVCRTSSEKTAVIACDEMLSDSLFNALSGLRCIRGSGVTVSRIITEAKGKLELGGIYGAVAVDMETYEVLSACARFSLKAAALRVISDEATRDIPDFNRAYDANGRMNGWRIARAMIARPVVASRFLLTAKTALRALKENLRAALNAKIGVAKSA
jgi:nucleoside phosphorylase